MSMVFVGDVQVIRSHSGALHSCPLSASPRHEDTSRNRVSEFGIDIDKFLETFETELDCQNLSDIEIELGMITRD